MPRLLLLSSLAVLALACADSSRPAQDENALAVCSEAPAVTCDNGQPLCFVDHERVCQVCRCSAFALIPLVQLPSAQPGFIAQPVSASLAR